jgi:hypothetical protein
MNARMMLDAKVVHSGYSERTMVWSNIKIGHKKENKQERMGLVCRLSLLFLGWTLGRASACTRTRACGRRRP